MPDPTKIPSPSDILGSNSIPSPSDILGGNEKKKPTATVTPKKLASATPIGSSGGAGFPEIDTNSVAPGMGKQPTAKVVNTKPIPKLKERPVVENNKEETDFWDYLQEGLDTGIAIASKSIYDTPALIYDNVAGLVTNPIFRAMGVDEDKLASSKKLADNLGFKNIPSQILKDKIKVSNEKINTYALKNGVDPLTAIENGQYKNAAKLVAGTTVQSLPMMVVALLSGGAKTALTAIGLSTASTKNAELEESNPEMGLATRVINANNAGIIEATTGHLFTGASGAVMKKIIADKGVEVGSKIIGKSFRSTIEKSIEKNPLVGAIGEVIEESAVEFGNQANDIASGIRTEFDIRAIKNAGLSATGMGGIQTIGVYGAKGYVKAKTYAKVKATNKEVFKLRSEIENGNLSDENKVLLGIRADRLEAENKKTLGTELEKVKALPTEQKTELNALNIEFEDLKSKFDAIDDADDIPANLKPAMKEELKLQAAKNQKRKTEILSQNDGLEVKGDFSKFEGVEPDFDLENGKISSLPLKEQNRLNKLAVQELTNGDKTIEYTKEQVSETANKIYANEKLQTTTTETQQEAQPKAEEQKTSEADKVEQLRANEQVELKELLPNAELKADGKIDVEKLSEEDAVVYNKVYDKYDKLITPLLEDVVDSSVKQDEGVSTVVENPISSQKETEVVSTDKTFKLRDKNKFYHASPSKRNGRLKVSNAPGFGSGVYFSTDKDLVEGEFGSDNTTEVSLKIEKPVYTNTKEWNEVESLAIEMADKDYGAKNELTLGEDDRYFRYDKDNLSEVAEIPSKFISEAAKSLGYDALIDEGSTQYTDEIVVLDESKIIYPEDEATSTSNSPTDGNVSIGATNVGESGNAKPKSTAKESVSKPIDGGEGKGDVEVSDLDHAKDQIEKGVLQWNSDIGAERVNLGITWADIRKGEKDIKAGKVNTVPAKRLIEALKSAKEKGGYEYVQGAGGQMKKQFVSLEDIQRANNEYKLTDVEQREVNEKEAELAKSHKEYFDSLDEQTQIDILENYENRGQEVDNKGKVRPNSKIGESKNDVPNGKEGEGAKPKPTAKERVAERVKLSDAKIDANSEIVKAKLKAFTDMFPSADINPDDYKSNGFSAEAIVDMVAKAAKSIAKGAIVTSEHINEAIKAFNTHFDDEVDFDAVSEKVKPKQAESEKEADNDFKSKKGKKSLLGRLIEGGNSAEITNALKELGENYDTRNQKDANAEAIAFIDKVGASEALKAVKDGLVTNSDVKMLIYDEALTRLKNEISEEINRNPEDREELIKKFQEVSDDFDNAVRDAGQGLAILNYIYNKNQTLKYNLKKQIADWKRNDPNGEIPAEMKARMEDLDKKLKDVEERTKEAEARAKVAEDELAIKNIQEDIERKNQAAKKNKSGLTPKEQSRKNELRNKFAKANDIMSVAAQLADPEFREYLGLVFKQAKGDFANFSSEILKDLGKEYRKHLPELFKETGGKGDVKVTDLASIKIGKDGKIKIPAQLLRDYVEAGETDIDVISQLIKDDISDDFPDVDLIDIRDALTGYGKQINPNADEITAKVNKLKEYGRLLSAYNDVMNGQMPKKSGLKREKPETRSRQLRRDINRLAKELDIEPIDLETQWASAIEKVKSQLKNQIEDLNQQIAKGEKRKVERTSIKLDAEAEALKATRDALKEHLDNLVGKPELTEEQKITRAETALENSIKKIQDDLDANNLEFKEKPTPVNSAKIESLKAQKEALLKTKKQLREQAGIIEAQRLKTAKTRVQSQIKDLKARIKNNDFAKKEIKPILADNELNSLRAEKEALYEDYEKLKYIQDQENRSMARKFIDTTMEGLALGRAIKASLDLGLIGIQLRGFTYAELWRSPKDLGKKFLKLFGAIGSQSKTNKAMSTIIGHPLYALSKKLNIGVTHPDLRNEVREEIASGNLLHVAWNLPIIAAKIAGKTDFTSEKRKSVGDTFIDGLKAQFNKISTKYQLTITEKQKFSREDQWANTNLFESIERGLSTYGNQLRFEEFVRGVDRLKAEGKDEINHLEDYELLASYIRTFSGRANPASFRMNQKALNVFFFSFKNAVSIFQQLNPFYYLHQHINSTDFKNGNYTKMPVANKMAMATMFKSVASTAATMLFLVAGYNAFKDDEEEEMTIETDPRSSDFGKLKVGDLRYDPWGGYIPLITLYARVAKEEVKKSDGTIYKFGEERNGVKDRMDATSRFLFNKESPGFQMFHHYMTSVDKTDKVTGEVSRVDHYGNKLSEDEAFSMWPIFLGSVKDAVKEDAGGYESFLTAYSVLGLGNVQKYTSKVTTPEDDFKDVMEKRKMKSELTLPEKKTSKVESRVSRAEGIITEIERMKIAQKLNLPYYTASGVKVDVSKRDFSKGEAGIEAAKKNIDKIKLRYGIKDKK